MELMEMSLSDLIKDQNGAYFALPVVVDIIVQIARGMLYLHNQGIAHRDLKPQNVVVSRQVSAGYYCVKLVDFGMSKTEVEASKSNPISLRSVGTTRYRAPEVHPETDPNEEGKVSWFKVDVYSFAMTCAHVLSLKQPFEDMKTLKGMHKELLEGRRPELRRDCPPELVNLLRDCWAHYPQLRPSFLEICTRLEIFRHKVWRDDFKLDIDVPSKSVEFINIKLEEFSSTRTLFVDANDDEMEDMYSGPRRDGLLDLNKSSRANKSIIGHDPLLQTELGPSDLRDLGLPESIGEYAGCDSGPSCSFPTQKRHVKMEATGEGCVRSTRLRVMQGSVKEECQVSSIHHTSYLTAEDLSLCEGDSVCNKDVKNEGDYKASRIPL